MYRSEFFNISFSTSLKWGAILKLWIYFSLSGPSSELWATLLSGNIVEKTLISEDVTNTNIFQCPDYFKLPSFRIIQHKINGLLCILIKSTTCLCRKSFTAISMASSVSWLEKTLVRTVSSSSTITFFGLKNICFRSTCSLCFLPFAWLTGACLPILDSLKFLQQIQHLASVLLEAEAIQSSKSGSLNQSLEKQVIAFLSNIFSLH